jgi:hypothetical protein
MKSALRFGAIVSIACLSSGIAQSQTCEAKHKREAAEACTVVKQCGKGFVEIVRRAPPSRFNLYRCVCECNRG